MQASLPATSEYCPTSHVIQFDELLLPAVLTYVPLPHAMQSEELLLPAVLPYRPAGHPMQASLPATSAYCPAPHAIQSFHVMLSFRNSAAYRPATHSVHTSTFPPSQLEQLSMQRNVPEKPSFITEPSLTNVISILCPLDTTGSGMVLPLLPLPSCGAAVDRPSYTYTQS